MPINNKAPKQHHYLPQTYLKGFASDKKREKVFRYHANIGNVKEVSVQSICSQNKLYETLDEQGNKSSEIESNFFADTVEPIFPSLVAAVNSKTWLSNSQIADLAIFIALQSLRLPTSFEALKDISKKTLLEGANDYLKTLLDDEKIAKLAKEFRKEHPDIDRDITRKDVEDIISGKVKMDVNIPKNNIIRMALELAYPLSDLLCGMNWSFVFAPKGMAFITSDMPVASMVPRDDVWTRYKFGGFKCAGAVTFYPLTKSVLILLQQSGYNQKIATANKAFVRDVNKMLAGGFDRYLISHSEKLLKSLVAN